MKGSITARDLDDALASLKQLGAGLANRALADAWDGRRDRRRGSDAR